MNKTISIGILGVIVSVVLLAAIPTASAKLYGDANEDGTINTLDITYTGLIILGEREPTELADANGDGRIDVGDRTRIGLVILERAPFPGGMIKAAMIFGSSDTLDPAYKWRGWYVRKAGIYETLFKNDENMALTPELATGYERVSDTKWRIYLREGVTFHDGTPFDADAVVYSINRVRDPDNTRHHEYEFIDSIFASDDYTVTIITKEPYAPVIASLSDPVVSIVSPEAEDIDTEPVGTGPFKFVEFDPGISLSMERNNNYWGGAVKLEAALFEYISYPPTRAHMLEAGEVDMARGIPPAMVEEIDDDPDLEVISKETLRTYFMYVNTKKGPFDDVRVRQAINYAIDREVIVEAALEGVGGVAAKSVFPSVMPWSANDDLEGYSHSQTKALSLLEEAGITDTDGDDWLDYDGSRFELTIKTYIKRPELKPTAEVMVTQLEAIGIKASIQILDTGTLSEDMENGNYELALYAWGVAPSGDPDYFLSYHFHSTGEYATWTGYNNPEVDAWIELGRTTFDYDDRWDSYKKVQEQILEDSPELFVFYLNELVGQNICVIGYEIYPTEITFLTKDMYSTA